MNVTIKKCTVAELEDSDNFDALLREYESDLAIDGLPKPCAKIDMYRQLEALGKIHYFGAFINNLLVGIINVLMSENPHYGVCIAVTESYFVSKEHRKTGAGNLLRKEAELCAEKLGSPALFISAHGNLILLLEGLKDYTESGRTFFKRFNHA